MILNADLHIHSRYSGGVSQKMTFTTLATEARKKGVELVGTGDCLHPKWLSEIRANLTPVDDATFELNGVRFVLTVEVEDINRVHHLIIFPSLAALESFREQIKSKTVNLNSDGRPNLCMTGTQIAEVAKDTDALIGPCHAFTPWTAIYAYHDTIESCYGELANYISFVELGLSADTDYADRIAELASLTFLTNSDAHSPYPIRLAREFNRFELQDATFDEIKRAILRVGGRRPVLNVGLPPAEGKYNESACIKCLTHYRLQDAKLCNWKCTHCGGRIKKGVRDRVDEISTYPETRHPVHRPPYLHLIPLAEIIAKAIGQESTQTRAVFSLWNQLIKKFGNEVAVLIDVDLAELEAITKPEVVHAIHAFRTGRIIVHPGGGGAYGKIELPTDIPTTEELPSTQEVVIRPPATKLRKQGQRSIFEY